VGSEGQAGIIAASLSEASNSSSPLLTGRTFWGSHGELDALRQIFADGADELEGEALEYSPVGRLAGFG
jgi:hypothetical protein